MNREILFRGKMSVTSEWIEGYLFKLSENAHFIMLKNSPNEAYEVAAETIGQYTGLTDKNGKKIFEGDILEALNGNRGYVVFEHGAFMKSCNPKDMPLLIAPDVNAVIGNCYDNPELLKGEEK